MSTDNLRVVIKHRLTVNMPSLLIYQSKGEDGLRCLIPLYSIIQRFKTDIIKRRAYIY